MNPLPLIDLSVLVLYLGGILLAGWWVGRRSTNPNEFMAAGGRVPAWAVGLSVFGTFVSSISFLALPGKAFAENWTAFAFSLSIPLAAWMAVRFFVPFYRRGGVVSAYEHLEHRFGAWARTYAVGCYLLIQLARMGTIMYLLALALAPLLGWNIPTVIVLTAAVVILYTFFGGMEAVIWTDVAQSIVLIGGALACAGLVLFDLPQGPSQLFAIASEHHKFSLGDFGTSLSEATFWVVLVYGLFINLHNFGIDQSYVQRYHTARSEREARRSVWLGGLLYLPVSALFFFIGTGLFAFYTARPELLPAGFNPTTDADKAFPHFIVHQLPAGVTGLVIAAIFAAAQSTLSSSMNCAATLFLCDIYKRYFRPGAGERESMRVLRLSTVVAGGLGTGAALAMIEIKSALDTWWQLAGIFSGGMLGLFLLGRLSRRATSLAAAAAVVLGVLLIGWMTWQWEVLPAEWRSPFHGFLVPAFGTSAILILGLLFGRLMSGMRKVELAKTK